MKNQVKSEKPQVKYRAFYFSIDLIRFLETLPQKTSFKIISQQLIRCSTSIGANIVEAEGSASKREFLNYFHIAFRSANETKYWLAILRELYSEKKEEINKLIKEVDEISRILGSSILTMKGKRSL